VNGASAQLEALQSYFGLMNMNGAARVFHAAQELGVHDALRQGAMTAAGVAAACGLQERPVELLLDGLCALGTVESNDDRYTLAPVAEFLPGSYRNLGDEYWDFLPTFLRTGTPLAKMDSTEQSEAQYEQQVSALAWMMTPAAETLAGMLGMGTARKALRILDVGGGSGIWSLTCAQRDAASTVTVSDWPAITGIAASFAQRMGMADRFDAIPGNYHEVDLGSSAFDLAIVANVTHIETPEGNVDLLRRVRAALRPGGEIAIVDVIPAQPEGRLSASLYALGLGLRTESGQVHGAGALQQYLREAGFRNVVVEPIPAPPFTMGMVMACRGDRRC
jgi:2-polyprenyl-3-methyl-5-hydroxy-6-metoxy-1,4-benzoquinol methylase